MLLIYVGGHACMGDTLKWHQGSNLVTLKWAKWLRVFVMDWWWFMLLIYVGGHACMGDTLKWPKGSKLVTLKWAKWLSR